MYKIIAKLREKSRSAILAYMGLYLKQENEQTELQRRIKSELRRKSETSSQLDVWTESDDKKDDESDQKVASASRAGQVILVVAIVLIIVIGYMAVV